MEYKFSIYNYYTQNYKGDYLLYNSYTGTESFLKIPKEDPYHVHMCIEGTENINLLPQNIFETLRKRGFIVPESDNEAQKLQLLYFSKINDGNLHITILPTEQCNFRCKYCYESFSDGIMSDEVQNRLILYVQKSISKYNSMSVSWFGGEPLLAFSVIKNLSNAFLDICRKHRKSYTASITTNGYMLTYDMLRELKKVHITQYQITIDGLSKTHDVQKPLANGKGTFDTIIKNLEEIRDKEKSPLLSFTIRTNISKDVLIDINEYIKYFSEKFGNDKRFSYFMRPVMDLGGERVNEFRKNMLENDALENIYQILVNHPHTKFPFVYHRFLNPSDGVCYASRLNSYVINPKGNILKCTCHLEHPANQIGQIDENGYLDINESMFSAWLPRYGCNNYECFFAPVCLMEGCPAIRVISNESVPSCPHEKNNLSTVLQIIDAQNELFEELEVSGNAT